jgi:hypothetical protein
MPTGVKINRPNGAFEQQLPDAARPEIAKQMSVYAPIYAN